MAPELVPPPTPSLNPWIYRASLGLSLGLALASIAYVPLAWLGIAPLILGVWALGSDECPKSGKRAAALGVSLASILLCVAAVHFTLTQAVPGIIEAGRRASARKAVSNLRFIYASQVRFRDMGLADADGDGVGEFGFLGELAGAVIPRGGSEPMSPPLLAKPFETVLPGNLGGAMVSGPYVYAVYLPAKTGAAPESGYGGMGATAVDTDLTESHFIAYAWPIRRGKSGDLVYVINEEERILESSGEGENQGYSGLEDMPAWDAALGRSGFQGVLDGEGPGDGGEWHPWKGKKARTN